VNRWTMKEEEEKAKEKIDHQGVYRGHIFLRY
jgi:hypothetical protein